MIEDEIDEEEFILYKGVKVFTCCGTCKKMWKQNPDYYAVVSVKQAPQLAAVASKTIKPMKQQFCPVYSDTRVHPKSLSMEHKGQKIYFSKKRAMDRFKANPAKYEKNLK
jgi:YHS domain-containing protein